MLKNPDFAALARAYGAHGETVEETRQFAPAFERAAAAGKPSLIEVRIDPQRLRPPRRSTPFARARSRAEAARQAHCRLARYTMCGGISPRG